MECAMKKICLVLAAVILAGCQSPQTVAPLPPAPPPVPQPPVVQGPPIESAGPLAKVAVGTYMDAQEADLRDYMRGQGVMVARRGDGLTLSVASDRVFEGAGTGAWGNAFLISLYQVLAHYDHTAVEVNAYTDASGSAEQNLALSQTRARTIADALHRLGIAASRLTANGFCAANPKVTDAYDTRNRRIEIKIIPTPQG
jgi:outer membrane protein OmpA-like peptidoglycan-associated protein